MQSGRYSPANGRGVPAPTRPARNAESEKQRKPPTKAGEWSSGARPRDAKTASVANLQEQGKAARKTQASAAAGRAKPRASPSRRTDENRGTVKKLLSVYETSNLPGGVPGPGEPKPRARASKIAGTPSRINATRAAESRRGSPMELTVPSKRSSPVRAARVADNKAEGKDSPVRGGRKTGEEPLGRRQYPRKKTTPESSRTRLGESTPSAVTLTKVKPPEKTALLPVKATETPADIINSLLTSCLDRPQSGQRSHVDMLFAKCDEEKAGPFTVCSKRATDNIPSSEVAGRAAPQESEDERDIIIMLRRRNSEPNSARSCLLRCGNTAESTNPPLSIESRVWGLSCDTVENYYFWEPGLGKRTRPYWEVSLFKSNRSADVLGSRRPSGVLSITGPVGSSHLLQNGRFGGRSPIAEMKEPVHVTPPPEVKPWMADITHETQRPLPTEPFITLMDKSKGLQRELEGPPPAEAAPPPRVTSKDDQYKPPAHLLVYVKPSQRKLVTSERAHSDSGVNRKVHRVTKVARTGGTEVRPTVWHRHLIFTISSAVVLITGGFLFAVYLLVSGPSVCNLTPPIPGLVHGN